MATMKLRQYQVDIVNAVEKQNAIIKMPTGSGKTIVAAELIRRYHIGVEGKDGRMALFLVPTVDLVDQQASVLHAWCPNTYHHRFHGQVGIPKLLPKSQSQALVSTPQAFRGLQRRYPIDYGWEKFGSVIFDEVHHVLKNHPYRHIALSLKDWKANCIQVIGMSASLTYCVTDRGVAASLTRLCKELNIKTLVSPSIEELKLGGYVPQYNDNVEVERCMDIPEGVLPLSMRQPHNIYGAFRRRLNDGSATDFTKKVWCVIKDLEAIAIAKDSSFVSPLDKAKLSSWEEYAFKFDSRATTGREQNNCSVSIFQCLELWYTSLRLLVQSWEEDEQLVLQWLAMNDAITVANTFVDSSKAELKSLEENANDDLASFKTSRLEHHLIDKVQRHGEFFRCIIFVQQRITAVVISHWINSNKRLAGLELISGYVASRGATITPRLQVSKSEAGKTLERFRNNELKVLVATSVIEEVRLVHPLWARRK